MTMLDRPETKYATVGDANVAYQFRQPSPVCRGIQALGLASRKRIPIPRAGICSQRCSRHPAAWYGWRIRPGPTESTPTGLIAKSAPGPWTFSLIAAATDGQPALWLLDVPA